jgi:hypothetical protein
MSIEVSSGSSFCYRDRWSVIFNGQSKNDVDQLQTSLLSDKKARTQIVFDRCYNETTGNSVDSSVLLRATLPYSQGNFLSVFRKYFPETIVLNEPPQDVLRFILSNLEKEYVIQGKTYRIIKEIATGSFGYVFLAINQKTNEEVAVKVLASDEDPEWSNLWYMNKQGGHPHVVKYLGHGELLGKNWIVMEYIRGVTLQKWSDQGGEWTQDLEMQYKSACDFVLGCNIRRPKDNEEQNILIIQTESGPQVKLVDFGPPQ